jgi:hypothetical protein
VNHIRLTATILAGLLVSFVGVIAGTPAAFAMRPTDPAGAGGPTASPAFVTHGGMAGWEIAVIAVSAAAVVAVLSAVASRARFRASPPAAAS